MEHIIRFHIHNNRKREWIISMFGNLRLVFKHQLSGKWLSGNSLRLMRSNFFIMLLSVTTFLLLKVIEPFWWRTGTEKLFRGINSFALIRTLMAITPSSSVRGWIITVHRSPIIRRLHQADDMKYHEQHRAISECLISSC